MRSIQGSFVALPTPFRNGAIDWAALRRLIEFHVEGGTEGLVVNGTTGEAATLTDVERGAVVEFTRGVARRRLPVVAGVGTNSTATTCALARRAWAAGADAMLVVAPYYNRPSQDGLVEHFAKVAQSVNVPIVLYNIPSRTGTDLLPATVAKLIERCANVVAIKEASASLERLRELVGLGSIDVLCGDDPLIADAMQIGAKGAISVVGNLMPGPIADLVRESRPEGDHERAAALSERVAPLIRALFLETNPRPLKHAIERMGLASGELRAPLLPVSRETAERVEVAIAALGLE